MSLEGKIALVTGASRGIGKAVTLHLASLGATVVGTATSDTGAQSISQYLKEANATGCGMALNVTDHANVEAVLEALTSQFGAVNILVNNAGITRDNLMMRMSDDEWQAVIDTNLTAVFRMIKACIRPMMKNRWGRIISIGSVVGTAGNPGQANYCAAKAGVIGMSKSIAREIASRNITVNVVAPGFIDTDMTKALPENLHEALLQNIPMGRIGAPEDIAAAVGYLASDAAGYVTGMTLHVNGGMLMD